MAYKDPEKQRQYQADWHQQNKAERTSRQRNRRREYAEYLNKIKNVPCADCGVRYPPHVMDLDHLPQFRKLFNISKLSNIPSWDKLYEEVAKCEVVCSNCHRIRTWERFESGAS